MAMSLRMDMFAVATADAADHIGPTMLTVIVDIYTGHSQQIPRDQQHSRDRGTQLIDGTFPIHFRKVNKKNWKIFHIFV